MNPYILLYPKNWQDLKYRNPRNIKIVKGENLNLSKYPEIKKKINKEWGKRKVENKKIFSGAIYRLSGYSIKNGVLILEIGLTNYKEVVGTNYLFDSNKKFFNHLLRLGAKEGNPYKYFSMALSVGTVIETKDKYVLITRRSKKTGVYSNTFHTIAGQTEPKLFRKKPIDFSESMAEEIETEVGLKKNEYKIYFTALIINNQNLKPELTFVAKTKRKLIDILLRKKTESFEFELVFGIKKEELKKFFKSFPQREFCPPGLAAWEIYSKIERL